MVDIRKLRDYCLNLEHDDGKHKARLFSSILGMTAEHAEELQQILLKVLTLPMPKALKDFLKDTAAHKLRVARGFLVHRVSVTQQDRSNQARGSLSPSVGSRMPYGT